MPLAALLEFRPSRAAAACGAVALLVLAGRPDVAAQTVAPRPLGAGLRVVLPTAYPPADETVPPVDAQGRITLRDALSLALLQSPELASFGWEVRAREARLLQTGQRPNPVAGLLVEDLAADSVVRPQATVQLSQLIELGGKRAARQKLAGLNRDLAEWDFEAARLDLLTRVTAAYLDVLGSQQSVALTEKNRALVEQLLHTVSARVEAGVVSPIEQTKAGVALATARIDEQRARRGLAADRSRLSALWGRTTAVFESVEGDLTALPAVPALDLLQRQLAQSPELARWAAEIAQREAARAVETARGRVDVTVTAGYRRFTDIDSNALVIGASVPLPLFDRNRAAIQEASHRMAKAHQEQRAAEARVSAQLAIAYSALANAHDEAAALAAQVLPGARSAFTAIEEGYRLGRFGYLDVLDAQRTLVAAEGQHLRALTDVHKAIAQVERLIGMPLAGAAPPSVVK